MGLYKISQDSSQWCSPSPQLSVDPISTYTEKSTVICLFRCETAIRRLIVIALFLYIHEEDTNDMDIAVRLIRVLNLDVEKIINTVRVI